MSLNSIKRSTCSHQRKKEVACIMSKPVVSCLWGCEKPVNPQKLNIQEVHAYIGNTISHLQTILGQDQSRS